MSANMGRKQPKPSRPSASGNRELRRFLAKMRMRKSVFFVGICTALALGAPAPAYATGGFQCKTADGSELVVSLGFGHVPGAPLIATRLTVKGKAIPVHAPQWWLDDREMRLILTDADQMTTLVMLRVRPNGRSLDGTVEWSGKRRWVRCYED